MKKSELKNIIKECVKEVIFEEGILANIITEVAQGLQGASMISETRTTPKPQPSRSNSNSQIREQVLSAMGKDSYSELKNKFADPSLFEGTRPIAESNNKGGALAGVDPHDSGVNLDSIPGLNNQHHWAAMAAGPNRK